MSRFMIPFAFAAALAPILAYAQARNGNVFNGTAHQPTASVRSDERAAGVAPPDAQANAENRDLATMQQQLLGRAQNEAQQHPSATTDVYGTQPGGVVNAAPNTTGSSQTR